MEIEKSVQNAFDFYFVFSDQGYWFSSGRLVTAVVDVGPPADWVKINVRETVSLFLVYFS